MNHEQEVAGVLRAAFPALDEGLTFLDWGTTGLVPEPAREAVATFMAGMARCKDGEAGWVHVRHAATRQRARERIAKALGASADEVALVENTTTGLSAAAEAIPLSAGQNVVLASGDYGAVAVPWKQRRLRDEVELRFVPTRDGALPAADLLERIDDQTRVIAVSTCAWTTGALTDLALLGQETRMRGILLVVDAVQSFGVVPLDVKALGVDFLAVGGHKWLCSPFGAGFLYVDRGRAARMQPTRVGLLSGRPPGGSFIDWFQSPEASAEDEILFPATGCSFENGGTPSYVGAIGLLAAMELFGATDAAARYAHVLDLGDTLIAGLDELGLDVVTPRERDRRAGMVVFHVPGGAEAEIALAARLKAEGIAVSVRYGGGAGGVRVCLHGMNTAADVARLLERLRA